MSDSDENEMPSHATKPADVAAGSNFPSKLHGARIVKYNFLDLSKSCVFCCKLVVIYLHFA